MAKQRVTVKASELTGRNIYHVKNQTIHYDFLSKTAYILTNDVVGKYTLFELKVPIALLVFCFVGLATKNYFFSFALGIVIYAIFDLYFRLVFLKSLPISGNFVRPKREPMWIRWAKEMSFVRLGVIAALAMALCITMVANNLLIEYTPLYVVLNYILAAGALVFFILVAITIFNKHRNKY